MIKITKKDAELIQQMNLDLREAITWVVQNQLIPHVSRRALLQYQDELAKFYEYLETKIFKKKVKASSRALPPLKKSS